MQSKLKLFNTNYCTPIILKLSTSLPDFDQDVFEDVFVH